MRRRYHVPLRALGEPYFVSWAWAADGPANPDSLISGGINPTTASQYALCMHEHLTSGSGTPPDARRRFFAHADFLRDNHEPDGKFPYRFPLESYGLSAPWYSAMAQGEASSVLLRAYAASGDVTYLEAARLVLEPLARDISKGGVSYIREGDVFFEECNSIPAVHILNGHLYAAFAVWELLHHGYVDATLHDLQRAAIDTLRRWLPYYDVRGWSRYALAVDDDNRPHLATLKYHQFHIAQLAIYADMTGEPSFQRYSILWQKSLDDAIVRCRYVADSIARMAYGLRRLLRRSPRMWRPLALREFDVAARR